MIEIDNIKNDLDLRNLFETLKYKRNFRKENPTYMESDGLIVYTGSQGTGKTLSAVRYVYELLKKYPHSKLVTNLMLMDYPIVTLEDFIKEYYGKFTLEEFYKLTEYSKSLIIEDYLHLNKVFPFNDGYDLVRYSNLDEGVIFLIDEIQLYFSSLESRNINVDVMTEISQQRKQRKHIVCTSQVFNRLAKPLREQFSVVVKCGSYFRVLQKNVFFKQEDLHTDNDYMSPKGKATKVQWFFHKVEDYKRYDTYYKIQKGNFIGGEKQLLDIYDSYTLGGIEK